MGSFLIRTNANHQTLSLSSHHNKKKLTRPNIFIVKTIIAQLHDRLKDDGISEDLIKHVADRLGRSCWSSG